MTSGSIAGGVPGAPASIASSGGRASRLPGAGRAPMLPAPISPAAMIPTPATSALVPVAPVAPAAAGSWQDGTSILPAAAASAYESVLSRGQFPEPGTRLGLRV